MALNEAFLEKKHCFLFTHTLVFNEKHPQATFKTLSSSPSEENLNLGQKYKKQITDFKFNYDMSIDFVSECSQYGLFAKEDIPSGKYIGEYTGLITIACQYLEFNNYLYHYPIKSHHDLFYSIDAKPYGNHTRFINHSFTPNLKHMYAFLDGLYHAIFITNRDINKGEQLTYNYGKNYWHLRGMPEQY